VDSG
jgi:hypothetical protein